MKPFLAVALSALLCTPLLAQDVPPGATFYVALNGSDTAAGTIDAPFRTLERARDAVRKLKQAGLPTGGVEVLVREGIYERDRTFSLAKEDAGAEDAPIVWRAYPGEHVMLTGAKEVTGFVPYRGEILKSDVGAQGFEGKYFRQLYLNGTRQHLARYPNFDPANPHGGGFAYVDGEPLSMYRDLPEEELRVIHCRPGDARPYARPELAEVILFPRYNWINMSRGIAAVDPAASTITLDKDVAWGPFKGIRPLDRYYLRNVFEELDAPGEWYLDRDTWTLYYWPPEPLADVRVSAPVIDSVLFLGPGADWVTIRGFEIMGCEESAIGIRESEHVLIAGCTIHDTGGKLGYSAGVSIYQGHHCGVVGCDLYNVCNNGIRLSGSQDDYNTLTPTGHYADNNYLHHIGVLNGHGCGITMSGVAIRLSHNLIHDTTRCGIFGGGPDCVVEYNHIRHVNLETEDTGGYYCGGNWNIRGQMVRFNYVHDVLGYGRSGNKWTSPHFAWGIYLDDDHSGSTVYGNIVARTTLGGSHIHAGRDNTVENNIFVDHKLRQMQYSGHDPESWVVKSHRERFLKDMARPEWRAKYPELAKADVDQLYLMANNKFLRNIVSYHRPDAALYTYSRNDAAETNLADYNVIWHDGLPLSINLPKVPLADQWDAWLKLGQDTHSVVADPKFVDPEHDDYRLQDDSPAWKLGFKPIPVDEIGPYESPFRASWPIVEARGVREIGLVDTIIDLPTPAPKVKPQVKVPNVTTAPTADGVIAATEYPGTPLKVAEHPDGSALQTAPCELRLAHDATNLYVAVTVPAKQLKLGATWEQDDAAEVCFQAGEGPVFVVHGFANGKFESTSNGGAPAAAAKELGEAVRFAAKVSNGLWTGEWVIPLGATGVQLKSGLRLKFNVGVRRTETNEWIQWCGSGATYSVDKAGMVVME